MSVLELLKWQWTAYPTYHRSRWNLLVHILVLPLFPAISPTQLPPFPDETLQE